MAEMIPVENLIRFHQKALSNPYITIEPSVASLIQSTVSYLEEIEKLKKKTFKPSDLKKLNYSINKNTGDVTVSIPGEMWDEFTE
jgi:aminoglycoside phosphotransferase family enzyme